MEMLDGHGCSEGSDTWRWALDSSGAFTVSSLRTHIDSLMLPEVVISTRWVQFVPIKVNILVWRLGLVRLPTLDNLNCKGVDFNSMLCRMVESIVHVFFVCNIACEVWRGIGIWIGENNFKSQNMGNLYHWIDNNTGDLKKRNVLMVISYTCIWVLWTYRNDVTFLAKKYRKDSILDTIKLFAFNWLCHRNSKVNLDWIKWLTSRLLIISNLKAYLRINMAQVRIGYDSCSISEGWSMSISASGLKTKHKRN
ncbi:hypothetical protein LXL04_008291 [Taraxacum kok-saghyz]